MNSENNNKLKMTFKEGVLWKNIINLFAPFIDELNLLATKEGLKCTVIDPSRVSLIDFSLQKYAFEEYLYLTSDIELALNFNVKDMKKILKNVGKKDKLTIELKTNEDFIVTIIGETIEEEKTPSLNLSNSNYPIPTIDFKSTVSIDTRWLQETTRIIKQISDHFQLKILPPLGLEIIANNNSPKTNLIPSRKFESFVNKNSYLIGVFFEGKSSITPTICKYSCWYFASFVLNNKISKFTTISFSSDMPIKINIPISISGIKRGDINFYFAPYLGVKK